MNIKGPGDSLTIMNELVMPNDTNMLHNLMGGNLLKWMDIAAAMAAQKHAGRVCVTASVNNVSFAHPIPLGSVVTLIAKVARAFSTSLEVHIEVWSQNIHAGEAEKKKCNEAYFTFVCLDEAGQGVKVPAIHPVTDDEREVYNYALVRRQLKLLTAGKITLAEAPELKALVDSWYEDAGLNGQPKQIDG